MGEYLSPDVTIEERSASAGAVAGVSASNYGTVGWLRKGPENIPQLITSFGNFVETFGTYWRNSYVPFAIAAFFNNEGARAYVTRVVPAGAVKATNASCFDDVATAAEFIGKVLPATVDLSVVKNIAIKIDGAAKVDIDCSGAIPAATTRAEIVAKILAVSGITCTLNGANRPVILSDTTGALSSLEFVAPTAADATNLVLGLPIGGSYLYAGEALSNWTQEAAWKGAYYNQIQMCLSGSADYEDGHGGYTRYDVEIQEESAVGAADWNTLESYEAVVMNDDSDDNFVSTIINDVTNLCKLTNGVTYNAPRTMRSKRHLAEWVASGNGALQTLAGVLMRPIIHKGSLTVVAGAITGVDDGEGNITGLGITVGTIAYDTGVISITYAVAPLADAPVIATYYQEPTVTEKCCQLSAGTDGTGPLTRADVSDPALEAAKQGIYSFDTIEEIINLSLPDFSGIVSIANDMIAYAENRKNKFVILTTPLGTTPQNAVVFVRSTAQYNTKQAALYYPWVKIADPIANDGRGLNIPPDGFVAGVYARTDIRRNVGKAPAGINEGKIVGAIGLERTLDKGERDILYPARINPIITSTATGRAIWGARTLSKNAEWIYVQAVRLFMFCEQSILDASYWKAFENNGPGLWAKSKAQGSGFLLNLFNDSYFAGATPSEAYFIKIDGENNPQSAIDAGILTEDYYLAPNKPGEFVRLRFQQKVKAAA